MSATGGPEPPTTEPEPASAGVPPGPRTPPAFALSCVFGAVGVVLLLAGVAVSSDAVAVAGMVAGALSLAAALYWRSELVSAWAARTTRARRR